MWPFKTPKKVYSLRIVYVSGHIEEVKVHEYSVSRNAAHGLQEFTMSPVEHAKRPLVMSVDKIESIWLL